MYPRGRAGRVSTYRGRGRGQQNNSNRYVAPEADQIINNQRLARRDFVDNKNQSYRHQNTQRGFRNSSQQRQNAANQSQQRNRGYQKPQRSRSASSFNTASTFQITERFPARKIVVPRFDKNQKMVHTCSTISFEMDLFVSNPTNIQNNNYTMLSFITMAFFFGNYGPVDGKPLVPSKRKNTQKRNMVETVDHTMQQIVEHFQTLPRMSTEEENFSERMCSLFDTYSEWCNNHLRRGDGYHKLHDITKNRNWNKKNEPTNTENADVSDINATEQ